MTNEIIFRKAVRNDLEQLIDLTIESFNGSNGRSFYESLFDISREDYRSIVKKIFLQNIPSNEYDLNSYFVLSSGNKIVSCLAGWKEGAENIESERLLPMMVLDHIGIEKWMDKSKVIERISELNIKREKGKIQIENMFLIEEFRGTSAFFKIYYKTVDALFTNFEECNTVQSRFFTSNQLAIKIAKHIGYTVTANSSFDDDLITPYFPNEGLVMTELEREIFYSKNRKKSRGNGK